MTPAGYDSVIDKIVPAAEKLKKDGANAISIMGTSLTFYKGAAFNQKLQDSVRQATGLPVTSMSNGIIEGLNEPMLMKCLFSSNFLSTGSTGSFDVVAVITTSVLVRRSTASMQRKKRTAGTCRDTAPTNRCALSSERATKYTVLIVRAAHAKIACQVP